MRFAPPTALAAVAAATTPVVAAAVLAVAVVAWACDPGSTDGAASSRPPGASTTPASSAAPAPSATAVSSAAPAPSPTAGSEPPWPAAWRLVVVADPTIAPRASVVSPDPAGTDGAITGELTLPPDAEALAALVAADDGAVAAVDPGGRVWVLSRGADLVGADPPWHDLGPDGPSAGLAGPVLGATWNVTSDALLVLSGTPGSGLRRTTILTDRLDGVPVRVVEVPLEADGPGLAALPDGFVAFIVRDLRDRAALARLSPAGSFVTLPAPARGVAAGGDVVAMVDDAGVRAGGLDALRDGVLPVDPLPLEGPGGVGAVAIAADGSLIAAVRLDEGGAPDRIDVLAREGEAWDIADVVPLDGMVRSAIVAWIRVP